MNFLRKIPSIISAILFLFPFTNSAIAQNGLLNNEQFFIQQITGETYLDISNRQLDIYLCDEWLPAKIVLASGDVLNNLKIRYNCDLEQIIWQSNLNRQVKIDKECVKAFYLFQNKDTLFFKKLSIQNYKPAYYQIACDGYTKLYIQRKVKLLNEVYKGNAIYYQYQPQYVYNLLFGEKCYSFTKPKIKSLYSLFPDKKSKIKQFYKQFGFRIKSESTFINFIRKNSFELYQLLK